MAAEWTGFQISMAWVSLPFKIWPLVFLQHPKPSFLAFMFTEETKSCSSHFVLLQILSSLLIFPTLPHFLKQDYRGVKAYTILSQNIKVCSNWKMTCLFSDLYHFQTEVKSHIQMKITAKLEIGFKWNLGVCTCPFCKLPEAFFSHCIPSGA